MFFRYRKGLYVPDLDLWLDSRRGRRRAFASHAHADHIAHHDEVWATPETLRFCRLRLGGFRERPIAFGESIETRGFEIRLHPSGHILGAAQISLVRQGRRLVYTGDFNLNPGPIAAPCEVVPCDDLVLESTYGVERYRFPRREEEIARLTASIDAALAGGAQPVVLAYALGRAQELIQILGGHGLRVAVAEPIWRVNAVYSELGIDLAPCERLRLETARGKVILVPPHWSTGKLVRRLHRPVRYAVTGWAAAGLASVPYPADEAFVVSDHADFPGLLEYVRRAKPQRVFTIHGRPEFAERLRALGIDAHPVESIGW